MASSPSPGLVWSSCGKGGSAIQVQIPSHSTHPPPSLFAVHRLSLFPRRGKKRKRRISCNRTNTMRHAHEVHTCPLHLAYYMPQPLVFSVAKSMRGGKRILNSCKIFSRVSKGQSGVRRGAPAYSAAKSTLLRIWDM